MEQFTSFFFNQGVIGVLAIGEFFIIWFLYNENKTVNKARLEDLKTMQNVLLDPLKKLQDTSDKLIEKMDQANAALLNTLSKKQ